MFGRHGDRGLKLLKAAAQKEAIEEEWQEKETQVRFSRHIGIYIGRKKEALLNNSR